MTTVTIIRSAGDWEGVYVDDDLVYENHHGRAYPDTIADIVTEHDVDEMTHHWQSLPKGHAQFPESLTDAKDLLDFEDE